MAKNKNTKGFTLIELLIVILIIGILAVAFLPTVLGAPTAARDTQRIAVLGKIQKALIAQNLETGLAYPSIGGCINDGAAVDFAAYKDELGGSVPVDPNGATTVALNVWNGTANVNCDGEYAYSPDPGTSGTYEFGLYARVEDPAENGNIPCSNLDADYTGQAALIAPGATTDCYAILTK